MNKIDITISPDAKNGIIRNILGMNNSPRINSAAREASEIALFKQINPGRTRYHDPSLENPGYALVNISQIFPLFHADENDPRNYNFKATDYYLKLAASCGTELEIRLGEDIEHCREHYKVLPPPDPEKWARICLNIIRHYNEGWADGFSLGIKYWEIWNEADLDPDDSPNKRTWGGTKAQFFDLFEITAKHLKSQFPELKIGGPALAYDEDWAEDFLCEMQKRQVPIDFFSWHIYCTEPVHMTKKAERIRTLLDKYGYNHAESILNEWNYVKGWTDEYLYSLKTIHAIKGASFVMSCMCECQKSSVDMLMYYDTRPSVFNGVFDFYTYEKLKSYYALFWYGMLYDCEREVIAQNRLENIYSLCGVDSNGKLTILFTYYSDSDDMPGRNITLDTGKKGVYEIYRVDAEHNGELTEITENLSFELELFNMVLIKEK